MSRIGGYSRDCTAGARFVRAPLSPRRSGYLERGADAVKFATTAGLVVGFETPGARHGQDYGRRLYREDSQSLRARARRHEARAPDRPGITAARHAREGQADGESRCARLPKARWTRRFLTNRRRACSRWTRCRRYLPSAECDGAFVGPTLRRRPVQRETGSQSAPDRPRSRIGAATRPASRLTAGGLTRRACFVSTTFAVSPGSTSNRPRSRRSVARSSSAPTPTRDSAGRQASPTSTTRCRSHRSSRRCASTTRRSSPRFSTTSSRIPRPRSPRSRPVSATP